MKKLSTILILLVLLMGCREQYYKYDGYSGYTDIAMGERGYQIEYVEYGKHGDLEVKKKCIIRAAEIGKHKGYSYFFILDEDTKILSTDVLIKEKTVIEETLNEEGEIKTVITKTPSHYAKEYKTVSQITVQYKNRKEDNVLSVQEILATAINEGYIQL